MSYFRFSKDDCVLLFVCDFVPSLFCANSIVRILSKSKTKICLIRSPVFSNVRYRVPLPTCYKFWYFDTLNLISEVDRETSSLIDVDVKTFEKLSLLPNVTLIDVEDVNGVQCLQSIEDMESVSAAFSIRFHQIFSPTLLKVVSDRGPFVNIHGGTLPQYKGLMNVYHMILNSEPFIGWTAHEIVPELDSGRIVSHVSISLPLLNSVLSGELQLGHLMAKKLFGKDVHQKGSCTCSAQADLYSNITSLDEETLALRAIRVATFKEFCDHVVSPMFKAGSTAYSKVVVGVEQLRQIELESKKDV